MGWKPTSISWCKLWLDTSQITGLSDGATVSSWTDASGNGYNATQTTEAQKPVYKTSVQSGKPALLFNGSKYLTLGVPLGINFAPQHQYSTFIVFKAESTGYMFTKHFNSSSSSSPCALYASSIAKAGVGSYTNSFTDVAITSGAFNLLSVVCSGASTVARVGANTTTLTTGSSDASSNGYDFMIGARRNSSNTDYAYGYSGYICEVIQYDSALSDTDRQKVEAYLNWKWFGGADTGGFGDTIAYLPQPIIFY